jgi:hypothetical protein
MARIQNIQHREPRSNTTWTPTTKYGQDINCNEFVVERETSGEIKLIFSDSSRPGQGIELSFDSNKPAATVAGSLLAVADGCSSKLTAKLD